MRTEIRLGATLEDGGVRFRVWAKSEAVRLVVHGKRIESPWKMAGDGIREMFVQGLGAGARYGYEIDGQGPFPDMASRFQPEGVHGLSEVVDAGFAWSDGDFALPEWRETVLYELHVGSFSEEGTWEGAAGKLGYLRELGVNAVEVMPVASFPGRWNWGYDGVGLYAPSANYGRPEEFRSFVNEAHRWGLAVYLDVVYNHLGPDGAYHRLFHPDFYQSGTHTPWGEALRYEGVAREFWLESVLHWVREYHVDGFRLDATHAIQDEEERHFVAELTTRAKAAAQVLGRQCRVVAEDERNEIALLSSEAQKGWGLDAVWADDFHHQMRVGLAGDRDGYYSDYRGTVRDVVETLENGWYYRGQHSEFHGRARGSATAGVNRDRFVICVQNHDQVGNRAQGERLHHQVGAAEYVAASALLLLAPETPLLFMGQEWAASSPFLYFTDHNSELGRLVSEGRRREFAHFTEFASDEGRQRIPDPQAAGTFAASKLRWDEIRQSEHARVLDWYRQLLAVRRAVRVGDCKVEEKDGGVLLTWRGKESTHWVFVAWLGGAEWEGVPQDARPILMSDGAVVEGGRCRLAGPGFAILQASGG